MKKIYLILLTVALFGSQNVFAQNLKIGYASPNYILASMPQSKQIESQLDTYGKQLENQLDNKIKEFEGKYQAYEAGKSTMTELIRADKEQELQMMNKSIQDFQKKAQDDLQKKENELLAPLVDKVNNAINQVAAEKGYTYIFSSDAALGASFILHAPEGDDVSDLVLAKLGVTKK
ncbi:OmpH family outer membrane protein [Hyphobacterium sp. CCMP332]|nr:OmpH family outer membrane protein [Hyphobacterium sp. CCMP332]